jgi:hypothetical protein
MVKQSTKNIDFTAEIMLNHNIYPLNIISATARNYKVEISPTFCGGIRAIL